MSKSKNTCQPLGSAGALKSIIIKIKASRFDSWTYVSLDYDNDPRSWTVLNKLIMEYRDWLEDYVGTQDYEWQYRTGDRYAQGIYIKDAQAAMIFKLKFGL